jgi:hypothetical protein
MRSKSQSHLLSEGYLHFQITTQVEESSHASAFKR